MCVGYGVMMARGREWWRMLGMGLRFGGNPPRRIERNVLVDRGWTPAAGNRPHERKRNVLDSYSESFVGLV